MSAAVAGHRAPVAVEPSWLSVYDTLCFTMFNDQPLPMVYQIFPTETPWVLKEFPRAGALAANSAVKVPVDVSLDESEESGVVTILLRPLPSGVAPENVEMNHLETRQFQVTVSTRQHRERTEVAPLFISPSLGCRQEHDLLCLPRDGTPSVHFAARYIEGWGRKVIVMSTGNPFKALWFLFDGITPLPFTVESTSHRTPIKFLPQAQMQFQDLTRVDLLRTVAALGEMANWYSVEYACLQCTHEDPELIFYGQHPTHVSDSDPNKLRFFRIVLVVTRDIATGAIVAPPPSTAPTPAPSATAGATSGGQSSTGTPSAPITVADPSAPPTTTNSTYYSAPFLWLHQGVDIEEFLARHGANAGLASMLAAPPNLLAGGGAGKGIQTAGAGASPMQF